MRRIVIALALAPILACEPELAPEPVPEPAPECVTDRIGGGEVQVTLTATSDTEPLTFVMLGAPDVDTSARIGPSAETSSAHPQVHVVHGTSPVIPDLALCGVTDVGARVRVSWNEDGTVSDAELSLFDATEGRPEGYELAELVRVHTLPGTARSVSDGASAEQGAVQVDAEFHRSRHCWAQPSLEDGTLEIAWAVDPTVAATSSTPEPVGGCPPADAEPLSATTLISNELVVFSDRGAEGYVGRWTGEDVGLEPSVQSETSTECGIPPEGTTAYRAVAGANDPDNPNPETRINYAGWGVWAQGGRWDVSGFDALEFEAKTTALPSSVKIEVGSYVTHLSTLIEDPHARHTWVHARVPLDETGTDLTQLFLLFAATMDVGTGELCIDDVRFVPPADPE